MPKYTTDICAHCGADRGLHQFETDLCPRFGRESFPAPQQWDETKFEDAGEKRLRDAAPELLAYVRNVELAIRLAGLQKERGSIYSDAVALIELCGEKPADFI